MSIHYTVPGFELTTFETWVSSHNHMTRAPTLTSKIDFNGSGYGTISIATLLQVNVVYDIDSCCIAILSWLAWIVCD